MTRPHSFIHLAISACISLPIGLSPLLAHAQVEGEEISAGGEAEGMEAQPPTIEPETSEPADTEEAKPEEVATESKSAKIAASQKQPPHESEPERTKQAEDTRRIGVQLMSGSRLEGGGRASLLPAVGIRNWLNEANGYELGVSGWFYTRRSTTFLDLGIVGSYLFVLGASENMVVFAFPLAAVSVSDPGSSSRNIYLNLRAGIGAEIRLGMVDLPNLAVTTRLSVGGDITFDGNRTTVLVATGGGSNMGLMGLFNGTIGFLLYL